ncbi:MAG: hypothetical protein COA94_01460 [Rickettsiales bacterium]|nr:MAG: hypothetical protein COA94_01460 [Rickettsiales bacterium]
MGDGDGGSVIIGQSEAPDLNDVGEPEKGLYWEHHALPSQDKEGDGIPQSYGSLCLKVKEIVGNDLDEDSIKNLSNSCISIDLGDLVDVASLAEGVNGLISLLYEYKMTEHFPALLQLCEEPVLPDFGSYSLASTPAGSTAPSRQGSVRISSLSAQSSVRDLAEMFSGTACSTMNSQTGGAYDPFQPNDSFVADNATFSTRFYKDIRSSEHILTEDDIDVLTKKLESEDLDYGYVFDLLTEKLELPYNQQDFSIVQSYSTLIITCITELAKSNGLQTGDFEQIKAFLLKGVVSLESIVESLLSLEPCGNSKLYNYMETLLFDNKQYITEKKAHTMFCAMQEYNNQCIAHKQPVIHIPESLLNKLSDENFNHYLSTGLSRSSISIDEVRKQNFDQGRFYNIIAYALNTANVSSGSLNVSDLAAKWHLSSGEIFAIMELCSKVEDSEYDDVLELPKLMKCLLRAHKLKDWCDLAQAAVALPLGENQLDQRILSLLIHSSPTEEILREVATKLPEICCDDRMRAELEKQGISLTDFMWLLNNGRLDCNGDLVFASSYYEGLSKDGLSKLLKLSIGPVDFSWSERLDGEIMESALFNLDDAIDLPPKLKPAFEARKHARDLFSKIRDIEGDKDSQSSLEISKWLQGGNVKALSKKLYDVAFLKRIPLSEVCDLLPTIGIDDRIQLVLKINQTISPEDMILLLGAYDCNVTAHIEDLEGKNLLEYMVARMFHGEDFKVNLLFALATVDLAIPNAPLNLNQDQLGYVTGMILNSGQDAVSAADTLMTLAKNSGIDGLYAVLWGCGKRDYVMSKIDEANHQTILDELISRVSKERIASVLNEFSPHLREVQTAYEALIRDKAGDYTRAAGVLYEVYTRCVDTENLEELEEKILESLGTFAKPVVAPIPGYKVLQKLRDQINANRAKRNQDQTGDEESGFDSKQLSTLEGLDSDDAKMWEVPQTTFGTSDEPPESWSGGFSLLDESLDELDATDDESESGYSSYEPSDEDSGADADVESDSDRDYPDDDFEDDQLGQFFPPGKAPTAPPPLLLAHGAQGVGVANPPPLPEFPPAKKVEIPPAPPPHVPPHVPPQVQPPEVPPQVPPQVPPPHAPAPQVLPLPQRPELKFPELHHLPAPVVEFAHEYKVEGGESGSGGPRGPESETVEPKIVTLLKQQVKQGAGSLILEPDTGSLVASLFEVSAAHEAGFGFDSAARYKAELSFSSLASPLKNLEQVTLEKTVRRAEEIVPEEEKQKAAALPANFAVEADKSVDMKTPGKERLKDIEDPLLLKEEVLPALLLGVSAMKPGEEQPEDSEEEDLTGKILLERKQSVSDLEYAIALIQSLLAGRSPPPSTPKTLGERRKFGLFNWLLSMLMMFINIGLIAMSFKKAAKGR